MARRAPRAIAALEMLTRASRGRGAQRFLSEKTGTLRTTTILGSPAYMPPEQMQGAELTEAVDVWALAMLLWEMMVEAKPWEGVYTDFAQLKEAVCRGERVEVPPSAAAAFPAGYVAVIKAGTSMQVRADTARAGVGGEQRPPSPPLPPCKRGERAGVCMRVCVTARARA